MPLSAFHPAIQRWFAEELGPPTAPQRRGWPLVRAGAHTLIAAPTGSGKTLAAFLWALDELARPQERGAALEDACRVLYVSPLKALGNDVQKNLARPLAAIRARDADFPEIRVQVRSGDTSQAERTAMVRRPPHVLVTTPESLYLLLTSASGRGLLAGVRTAIVDEIHALLPDRRGTHLALSLERLEALAGPFQRIGLSATQKPLDTVGRFLVGAGRSCELVDEGHLRELDLALELPPSPLGAVCSHETWGEIYARIAELVREHRTTLVFVGTRKLAERASAELVKLLGEDAVACHHSSLARERRLAAEERLKRGELRALVATASLELGIDVGEIDLVVQIGTTRSIATFLQRVGRAGHALARIPRGRLFPLTQDELAEAAGLLASVRRGELDRTPRSRAALDVLAQQIVAECACGPWSKTELFERLRRAAPFTDLARDDFDALVALHARGRRALLHEDGVNGRLRGTARARLTAITCGGAIPDTTQYQVLLEPEGTLVGTLDEDFAVEASAGDVFQLGAASWRVLRVHGGAVHVADAKGAPPSLPFWLGEAPARTRELSAALGEVRERGLEESWLEHACGFSPEAARELRTYLADGRAHLGAMPTPRRFVLERFFDESGGAQLVLHALNGSRINRAFGLALRKRFCRRFGFELQAAANEDAILLSLGPQHSFPLEEVFDYLRAATVRDLLVQAVLVTPLFAARWRWNATRSLVVERYQGGKKVPPPLLRMRSDDALAAAFPDAVACAETLPGGDIPVPMDHPIVRQTIEDCLTEALDVAGLEEVLRGLEDGSIERVAVETREPSAFARSVLTVKPYGFLDDAPLEERRTQAVLSRRVLGTREASEAGALDPAAIELVRREAWPDPSDAEEVHEALSWIGYVTAGEGEPWAAWLAELERAGRAKLEDGRWYAAESTRDPKEMLRGRLEALGPVFADDPGLALRDAGLAPRAAGGSEAPLAQALLLELEAEGEVLRLALDGRTAWCNRRLLARIQRATLDRLRREIEPVSTGVYLRFLARWQHLEPLDRGRALDGPAGVLAAIERLAGWEAPAGRYERELLVPRVAGYRPEWLDELLFRGEVAWGRLFGGGRSALRSTPIAFFPRRELDDWLALALPAETNELSWPAQALLETLTGRGALFTDDLARAQRSMLPSDLERGLAELVAFGLAASDSFTSVRELLRAPHRRKRAARAAGRWSLLRRPAALPATAAADPERAEFAARALLRRYGVLFRAVVARERLPVFWRDLVRALRLLELRGELRGGRFVTAFSGEQFALPEAIPLLRAMRSSEPSELPRVSRFDPLALADVLVPGVGSRSTAATQGVT
jgi:ATP-dependent Lhr-like helicase